MLSFALVRLQNIQYQTQNISQNCTKQTAILYLCAIQNKQTMIFEFKNLGTIKEAQIEMGNLTVICGKNNTGKTYLTYAVWGMFEWYRYIEFKIPQKYKVEINEKGETNIDLQKILQKILNTNKTAVVKPNKFIATIFSANETLFKNTEFKVNEIKIDYENVYLKNSENWYAKRDKNSSNLHIKLQKRKPYLTLIDIELSIHWILMENFFSRIFLLTAQRDSVALFYKELIIKRANLFGLPVIDNQKNIFARPIEKNLDFAGDLISQVIKTNSFLQEEYPELLTEIETILGVNFIVGNDSVSIKDNKTETTIPDYMASTSVRSLLYLHFWLKHQAQKGDLLMIDEPELNLHPENQIKMARLFAKLVNVGIKVWITTHSDYIVKELNNLVMLGNVSDREEMLSRFKNEKGENEYSENDILKAEDLKAYIAYNLPDGSGATVRKIDVDKYGMVESTFDETINTMNKISRTFAQHIAD